MGYFCRQPIQTRIFPVMNARVKAMVSGDTEAHRISGGGARGILWLVTSGGWMFTSGPAFIIKLLEGSGDSAVPMDMVVVPALTLLCNKLTSS